MTGPEPHDRDDPDEQSALERWVLPYFDDMSLWPVLIVALAAIAAFMAPALVEAVRDLNLAALLAMGIVAFATVRLIVWEWRLRGRPGSMGGALLVVWALAVAGAWYGARAGLL